MARTDKHLVQGHLEWIKGEVFEQFGNVITEIVGGRNGIYALYDADRLYYVGLAKNLKARLKTHLRDRHKDLWDRFSVYVTNGDAHIKELESLMLRVIKPKGNRVKGRLNGSQDQSRELDRRIRLEQQRLRYGIIGKDAKAERPARKPKKSQGLRGHGATGVVFLRAFHKGKSHKATLQRDGTVNYKGIAFNSLSAAGRHVTKRGTNGRVFWRVRNAEGEWVPIGKLA